MSKELKTSDVWRLCDSVKMTLSLWFMDVEIV